MDRYPERFTPIVTVGLASALVLTWSVMSLAYAYNRSLMHMNDSFARRLMIYSELDDLMSTVDHLSLNQQAFLSTGDGRFQDGVYASAVTLDRHLDGLNASMARNAVQLARLARLSAAIKQVVDSVAQSYEVKDARGGAAALAFFDANEAVISKAKSQAAELRTEISRGLSDQILNAGGGDGLLKAIFDGAPVGFTFGRTTIAKRAKILKLEIQKAKKVGRATVPAIDARAAPAQPND